MANPFGEVVNSKQSSPEVDEIFGQGEGQGDLEDQQVDPNTDGQSSAPGVDTEPDLILGKFKDVDALAEAYVNIMEQKLKKEPDQFDTVEQLAEAYRKAESELGRIGGSKTKVETSSEPVVDNQQQDGQPGELEQLKQISQQQQRQLQQMAQYYQLMQAQAMYQQQKQNQPTAQGTVTEQAQHAEIKNRLSKITPEEFLDEFYKKPTELIEQLVEPLIEQRTKAIQEQYKQQQQQLMQQYIAPTQQYVVTRQMQDMFEKQVGELRNNIPDFKEYEDQIMPEINKDPALQNMIGLVNRNPSIIQMVVKTAYDRAKINRLEQQNLQQQQNVARQQNINQKKGAGITVGSGAVKRVLRQASPAEKEVADIFGLSKKSKGIFG